MDVVHIVEVEKTKETEAGFLVTYFLTKEEFTALQAEAATTLEAMDEDTEVGDI